MRLAFLNITRLDCTVLYCTVLYCTILYYTILYYTILYCTILYCTILYYTILYYTILYYTILYSGMSVIRTSDIRTHRSTERPSDYCFLINAHICDISWMRRRLCMCRTRSLVVWLFQILLFSHHLFLRCGSENVVCNSPKMKALCAEYKLQTYGIFIVMDRVQSRHVRITDIPLYYTIRHYSYISSWY